MAGTAPLVTRGFLFDTSLLVTAGYLAGAVVVTPTDTIITQGGTPIAPRTINVLQEQLGQRENSGSLRSHSSGKSGPLLGTRRRLGQS